MKQAWRVSLVCSTALPPLQHFSFPFFSPAAFTRALASSTAYSSCRSRIFFPLPLFASFYTLNGAAVARFAQLVILSGIAGTAWNALFNVVPSQKRGQVLAFNNGVPSQIGVVLSGVLLIVAERAFTVQQIFLMGMALALVCGVLIWRMRKAYAQALVDALRAGRIEVFSANETAFSGFQGDAAVLDVATRALKDSKATTRRLAAEMLGRMRIRLSHPTS